MTASSDDTGFSQQFNLCDGTRVLIRVTPPSHRDNPPEVVEAERGRQSNAALNDKTLGPELRLDTEARRSLHRATEGMLDLAHSLRSSALAAGNLQRNDQPNVEVQTYENRWSSSSSRRMRR